MGSMFGGISLFGESHGECVGVVIDGFPAGIKVDNDYIESELERRRGGRDEFSTKRFEPDEYRIISGVFNGYTTGAPICVTIPNTNVRSGDYAKTKDVMRPNHADYTAFVKYKGFTDYRGGGHFSARVTAALVVAGALIKQLLKERNIDINAKIIHIGGNTRDNMFDEILKAKAENDSVGGCVEVTIKGVPAGVGNPFFDTIESVLAYVFFAIPAVKCVEFGAHDISKMRGNEAKDEFYYDDEGDVRTTTNNCGGILGGITSGMPIVARLSFKPTPSIGVEQKSINIAEGKECSLTIDGRHDPCIVPRAVPVVEAAAAIGIWEALKDA